MAFLALSAMALSSCGLNNKISINKGILSKKLAEECQGWGELSLREMARKFVMRMPEIKEALDVAKSMGVTPETLSLAISRELNDEERSNFLYLSTDSLGFSSEYFVKWLANCLDEGASPDIMISFYTNNHTSKTEGTLLHMLSAHGYGYYDEDLFLLNVLYEHDANPKLRNKYGYTPIQLYYTSDDPHVDLNMYNSDSKYPSEVSEEVVERLGNVKIPPDIISWLTSGNI